MVRQWNQLSVLIVGCGSIGKRHARVLKSLDLTDIRACDPVSEQRASLSAETRSITYASYEAALKANPDVVIICTPPDLHVPMALQAVRAGCHVLCEKPLSYSTEGISELESLAALEKKKVMVGLCFRYHCGLLKAKHLLDSGCVGRLVSIRALFGEYLPEIRSDYQSLYLAKSGGAFELMHEVDLAIWFANRPVRKVHALSRSYSDIGIAAPDLVEILIDFDNSCMANVHLDYFQRPRRRQTELICTGGTLIVEFARWDRSTLSVYEATKSSWMHEEIPTERDDMFRAEDKEFLEAVAEDKPIRASLAEARKSVEILTSCQTET